MNKNSTISVVVCTYNNEDVISRCLNSVKWADEIVVVDDGSSDKTVEIVKKFTDNIYHHKSVGYVEPVRNFAIAKATGDWILILDADEEIGEDLIKELQNKVKSTETSYVEIPRKNIIFGKWMKASMWWPDYNIRFFKKGSVVWSDKIHSNPDAKGNGAQLAATEKNSVTHHHYTSISQFVERNSRYSKIQARELYDDGKRFQWTDLIKKPLGEFLGRYFANKGYEDGLHGLSLGLLQAFMFLLQYLYLWELGNFKDENISLKEVKKESQSAGREIKYWFDFVNLSNNPLKRVVQKAKSKLS